MFKKMSINFKLFCWFSFLVIFVILLIWILNSTVLEDYYLNFKEKSLTKVYNNINNIYNSSDNIQMELEQIEINQNIDIVIKDDEKITVYSTSKDFSNNIYFVKEYAPLISSDYLLDRLSGDTTYFTDVITDRRINADFVALLRKTC